MAEYDKIYKEKHHFGAPCPELVDFFKNHERRGKVLDLGCGQGRDTLALARLGYDVTGVDISRVGVNQMLSEATKEGLSVTGIVADIYEYPVAPSFDIVLLDSMLHFYKRERKKETLFLQRIATEMRSGSLLIILVAKSKTTEPTLDYIINDPLFFFAVLVDKYVLFPKTNSRYRMVVLEKHADG